MERARRTPSLTTSSIPPLTPFSPWRRLRQRVPFVFVPPSPDGALALDDELPEARAAAGRRGRRLLWAVALLALALRLLLLPLGHWWDVTVDYNVFIDLAHNHSPYDTMAYLSHIARASGWDVSYEYYAYPPVPLYLYYLPAKLFGLLHPDATYFIPVSSTFAMPTLPLDFYVLLKAPVWVADLLIAALLARMSGTIRGWRDYLVNPYVLLVSGAWTFDAVMVLGLVASVYYIQRGRVGRSALALAVGTMVKFIPAIAAPTLVLYLIKKRRPLREIALFLGVYAAACALLIGPFLGGLLYVLGFHGQRVGGGMNWEMFFRLGAFFPKDARLDPLALAVGAFGTPLLAIVLLLAYWHAFTSERMGLNRMILVTLLAFFVGSKLVNEQYALVIFPFAFLEAYRVRGAWRHFARLLWLIPLLYAVVRVPIDRFFWLFYHTVLGRSADAIAVTGKTGFEGPLTPWLPGGVFTQIEILVLGLAFWGLCVVALVWPVRPARRAVRRSVAHSSRTAEPVALAELAPIQPIQVLESDVAPEREVALPR